MAQYAWDMAPNGFASLSLNGLWRSPLCGHCQSIFRGQKMVGDAGLPAEHLFPQDFSQLESSARTCQLCHLRWHQLSPAERNDLRDSTLIKYFFYTLGNLAGLVFEYQGTSARIKKEFHVNDDGNPSRRAYHNQRQADEEKDQSRVEASLGPTNANPTSWWIAYLWLQNCTKRHEKCNTRGTEPRRLPTRLIELSPTPLRNADEDFVKDEPSVIHIQPRLRLCSELPFDTQYFTLSHCWGQLEFMTLTEENLSEVQTRIDITRLTSTFREAIEMTMRLGIRYIWIDSLCIIQNSNEDWRRESRLMGDVYQNALCNIGATKAKNGNDGLFSERALFSIRPCVVESSWYHSKFWPVSKKRALNLTTSSQWDIDSERSPLLKRAWAVQEQILSRRMLHFGEDQMSWECLEVKTNETSWHGSTISGGKMSLDRDMPMHNPIPMYAVTDAAAVDYNIWGGVVTTYSACDLTFPEKDKFVAISGIARNLCVGDTYLAGLWKNDLPSQLNWMTGSQTTQCRRPSNWRAPSWSWASIDGPVFHQSPFKLDSSSVLRIVDTEIVPAEGESDNFGQIVSGKIRLICTLLKLKYKTSGLTDDSFCLSKGRSANVYHDVGAFHKGEMLTCMPIYLSDRHNVGLVLERSAGPCGEFQRVGRYSIRFHNDFSDEKWRQIIGAAKKGVKLARKANEGDENRWHEDFVAASQSDWMKQRIVEDDYETRAGMTRDGIPQFQITLV